MCGRCKKPRCCLRKYALGAPVVGTEQVVYSLNRCLCELKESDLFIVTIPASTTSTLPPVVQLCGGALLPIVFSGTADPAEASGLIGDRAHLATIICVDGVPTMNVFDAQNAAAGA